MTSRYAAPSGNASLSETSSEGIPLSKWMDPGFYPVHQRTLDGLDPSPDAATLVDVGGGRGQDLIKFPCQHPHVPGKLVLQDLELTINEFRALQSGAAASVDSCAPLEKQASSAPFFHHSQSISRVEPVVHDFFTQQPVQHARAYYLRSVLHDWPPAKCVEILRNIAPTVSKGYGRILISKIAVPDSGWRVTTLGWSARALLGSKEKTEVEW